MGTTAKEIADTQVDEGKGTNPSFAEQVSEAVKGMKLNSKGVYELPEGLPEEVKVAAMAEKKFRDTQSAFTKTKQELNTLKAEKSLLLEKATENVTVELSKEQEEELEELKFSNPEAWRKKLNRYEREAVTKKQQIIEQEVKQISADNLDKEEIERRAEVLSEFKKEHPDFDLNDDIVTNDIPARITKKLEKGDITWEDYIQECYEYLNKGKVVKDKEQAPNRPNLSRLGGGSKPDDKAVAEDTVLSYAKEVY
jgi:hypothetical protein